ncbi:MAG: hypothetical protein MZV70_67570 [Desulfobacterales bacterium]|nr:hypothetical protein [Desulfobacterales bacterium]
MIACVCLASGYAAPADHPFQLGAPENHFLTQQYIEWAKLIEKNSKAEIQGPGLSLRPALPRQRGAQSGPDGRPGVWLRIHHVHRKPACSGHEGLP